MDGCRDLDNPPPLLRYHDGSQVPQIYSGLPSVTNPMPPPVTNPLPLPGVQNQAHEVDTAPKMKRRVKQGGPSKSKKKPKKVVNLSDDEVDGDESSPQSRWQYSEVQQLIFLRLEMDDEFGRNVKKQGVNTWDKLQGQMAAACEGFAKTSEACRTKWKTIYRQYAADKKLLQISGEGQKVTCKFFKDIDQAFNNRANVKKLVHSDALGTPNPCPVDVNDEVEGQGSGGNSTQPMLSESRTKASDVSPQSTKGQRKRSADIHSEILSAMVVQTTRIATNIGETTQIMKDLRGDLSKLVDKL